MSCSNWSTSAPIIAAIDPVPTGVAFCIASPLILSRLAALKISSDLDAASAEYSPREWPATKEAWFSIVPNRSSIVAITAIELAKIAGCAFLVN